MSAYQERRLHERSNPTAVFASDVQADPSLGEKMTTRNLDFLNSADVQKRLKYIHKKKQERSAPMTLRMGSISPKSQADK